MPPHQLGPFSHPNTMQFPPTPYGLSPHSLGTHHAHLATHQMSHTSSHLPMNQHRSTSQYAARYHQKLITDDPLSTPRRPLQTDSSETGSSENGSSPDSETHEIPVGDHITINNYRIVIYNCILVQYFIIIHHFKKMVTATFYK